MKMKKSIIATVFVLGLLSSIASAGEGATKWYGYFFDNSGATSVDFVSTTWLTAINRNSYPAKIKISYYNYSGILLNNNGVTVFEHSVAPNAAAEWTPHSDLFDGIQPPYPTYFAGSYVMKVTEGSIMLRSFMQRKMGDLDLDPKYSYLDQLSLIEMPPHTVTSTRLNMESFNLNFPTGTLNGLWDIHLHITNPDDVDNAIVKMSYYDSTTGLPVDLITHDTDSTTTHTFTLTPHQNKPVHPEDFVPVGNNTFKKYNAVFEVIQGSVTGNYITFNYYVNSNGITTYKTDGGSITKQLIIK